MKLFKNSVGRPSSKTLQKRKIAIFTIVFIVVLGVFSTLSFIMNRTIFAESKNMSVSYKEPIFTSVYSKQEQAVVKQDKKSTVV